MSAAAAAADANVQDAVPAKKKLSKKLVILLVAAVVLLAGAGGAAVVIMKKRAAQAAAEAAEAGEDGEAAVDTHALKKPDPKHPPTFLPLEPFVVNLADREADRYAQIGITLQVDDAKVADQLKLYMPAIRNGVLMILAHKTSAELLERSGKERLAAEIMREAVRPLGIDVELDPLPAPAAAEPGASAASAAAKPKKKPKAEAEHNPVEQVHFSSFIIQ